MLLNPSHIVRDFKSWNVSQQIPYCKRALRREQNHLLSPGVTLDGRLHQSVRSAPGTVCLALPVP